MNAVIQRKVVLTADWQPLSAKSLVGSFDISAPPANAGPVLFLADDGSEVPWCSGEYHSWKSVDLSQIFAKGTPGDLLTIVGGTW